ncbi:unnamed protein product [Durusdinium trenchii]|uniref:Uncharacterized protein n=1 Tax=Durusdinium trenchii TaxID=1381693 RepID=A0ABP0PNZ6_9DINO
MWRLVWLLSCGLGGALRPAEPSRAGAALLTAGTASFPVPDGLLFDRLPMSQVEQALGRVAAHLKLIFLPELVTMMLFMLTLLCATACGKWLDEEPAEGPDGRRRRRRTFIIVEGNEVAYDSQVADFAIPVRRIRRAPSVRSTVRSQADRHFHVASDRVSINIFLLSCGELVGGTTSRNYPTDSQLAPGVTTFF